MTSPGADHGEVESERGAETDAVPNARFTSEALTILVPGFIHRMRNSLTLFSSHAQMLALGENLAKRAVRSHPQLRDECKRIEDILELLGTAHGDEAGDSPSLGTMLRCLTSFYSFEDGLRQLPIEADVHAQLSIRTNARSWIVATTLLIDSFARSLPVRGPSGLRLTARTVDSSSTVELSYVTEKDTLPFPAPVLKLDASFATWAARQGLRIETSPGRVKISEAGLKKIPI